MNDPVASVIQQLWKNLAGATEFSVTDEFLRHDRDMPALEQLADQLQSIFAVDLTPEDALSHPTVQSLARHIEDVRGTGDAGTLRSGAAQAEAGQHPLASFGQNGLWFIDQYSAKPTAYSAPILMRLHFPLDTGTLAESLRTVVAQHESLRTTFAVEGGELVQRVSAEPHCDVDIVEFADQAEFDEIVEQAVNRTFDLEHGPLVRVVCAIGTATEGESIAPTYIICNIHHAVFDATSAGVFLTEWFTAYQTLRSGEAVEIDPDRPQYQDFARWQRNNLDDAALKPMLEYWAGKLAGPLPILNLPLDRPRPTVQSQDGAVHKFPIPAQLTGALRARAQHEDLTLFMLLLSAYVIFLHRHTRQEDLLVGSPTSLRDLPETRDMIGYFVNTVVFRHRITATMTLRELYDQVRNEVTESLARRRAPFEKVIEHVRPKRSTSHSPVFQTMFVMPNVDPDVFDRLGLDVDLDPYVSYSAKYDLSLLIEQHDDSLLGILEYDRNLFSAATVHAMAARFVTILAALVDADDTQIGQIPLLDAAEQREALAQGRAAARCEPLPPVTELFEAGAAANPAGIAVEHRGRALTYHEVNSQANRLARALRSAGIGVGNRVGIFLDRSPDMVVGLLGALKAGASYVPIDPAYPSDRIKYMLADSGVSMTLSQSWLSDALPDGTDVFNVDERAEWVTTFPDTDLGRVKQPDDEIYVIYTSGSTGQPKGVVLRDRTITNLVTRQQEISSGFRGRTLQYMTLSFDVSVMEILGTLCAGGTLVLIDASLQKDLHLLAEFIDESGINRVYLPYIALHQLATIAVADGRKLHTLEEVTSVGEQLVITPQIRSFFAEHTDARLLNMYGPSETHLATWHRLPRDPAGWPEAPPIGKPIAGLTLLVLDENENLLPFGVPGELHIGGKLISPGYHGLSEETARRFVRNPFADSPEELLYRTGDLVRYDQEHRFEYLGRIDHQIKIRGYRIEPAEIEATLNDLDSVTASAVAPLDLGPGDRRLIGYLVGSCQLDPDALRKSVRDVLPDYMVPSHIVQLDRLPTTPSGKLDRKALPELFHRAEANRQSSESDEPVESADASASSSPIEREVARQWCALLKIDRAGMHDDFFQLGGHSILATELVYSLRKAFGVDIALRALFEHPTVAGMATTIANLTSSQEGGLAPAHDRTALQADLWLPERVAVPEQPVIPTVAEAEDVLLTGATGFLGGYLLRDLLAGTHCRVHCLVRASDDADALKKIRANLNRYQLAGSVDFDRVRAIAGDLTRDRLGLADATYRKLASTVEVVYHAAAHINFVAPYASVRATNVDGVRRMLEFSVTGRVKSVQYMSTVAVFSPTEHGNDVITESRVPEDDKGLSIGYTQSKWVGERLALMARERGLPVTVYRIGRVSADSSTGACQPKDFLWRQIKSFIQLGAAPPGQEMRTDLLPVDFVSRAVLLLSRERTTANRTLHLFHPEGANFDVIYSAIRECGYPLDVVSTDEWFSALSESAGRSSDNALAAAVPLFEEGALEIGHNTYGNDATTTLLARLGLHYPDISPRLITSMINYFRRTGELEPCEAKLVSTHVCAQRKVDLALEKKAISQLPAAQQPNWADEEDLHSVHATLANGDGIVDWSEIQELNNLLAAAASGELCILQAGDCAEDPAECGIPDIFRKIDMMEILADVLRIGAGRPIVKVGRIAGQFAKPRSWTHEVCDGVELPVYRGPMVNRPEQTEQARRADPRRILDCHRAAQRACQAIESLGRGSTAAPPDRVWTSHEALLLDYELPMVRQGSGGQLYLSSTHYPWIGERTRQPRGAHVRLMALVQNPVACKVSAQATARDVLRLCEVLNPDRVPGRLTLIARFGTRKIQALAPLVCAAREAGHPVLWLCDPMHGNTIKSSDDLKVRRLDDIMTEIREFVRIVSDNDGVCAGLHMEASPLDICECDGAGTTPARDHRYQTLCDPRLNLMQAVAASAHWQPTEGCSGTEEQR